VYISPPLACKDAHVAASLTMKLVLKVKSEQLCGASLCQPRGQMVVATNSVEACRAPARSCSRVAEKPAVNGEESQRMASDGAGCVQRNMRLIHAASD
jgi:hypothetical protein